MIDSKTLLMGVAVVAGGYLLLSGKKAIPGGGKPLAQTGILPGRSGNGSFVLPGDTFTGFAPIERSKIQLPERPFIGYPEVIKPLPYSPSPAYVDDGDDGKPPAVITPGGIIKAIFNPLGGRKVPAIPKAPPAMGGGLGTLKAIYDGLGNLWGGMEEQYAKEGTKGLGGGVVGIDTVKEINITKKESLTRGIRPETLGIGMGVAGMKAAASKHYTKKETAAKEHRLVTQAKASQAYRSGRVTFGRGITGGN